MEETTKKIDICNFILSKQIKSIHYNKVKDNKIIFYIGIGKTGSSTICNSFLKNNCLHVHGSETVDNYFNNILKKNKLDIYDLVKIFGKTYKYKPIIIESIREPVSLLLSLIGEFSKSNFKSPHPYCKMIPKKIIDQYLNKVTIIDKVNAVVKMINIIIVIKPLFLPFNLKLINSDNNIKKNGFYYSKKDDFDLLLLKFENIHNWESIINNIGYEFKLNSINLTSNCKFGDISKYIKKNPKILNLNRSFLLEYYSLSNKYKFYSDDEIYNFVNKWSID